MRPDITKLVKVSKNRPSKICGRQPLKTLKWYSLSKLTNLLLWLEQVAAGLFTPLNIAVLNNVLLTAGSDFIEKTTSFN